MFCYLEQGRKKRKCWFSGIFVGETKACRLEENITRGALPVTFPQCHTKEKEKSVISLSYLICSPITSISRTAEKKRNNQAIILIRGIHFFPFPFWPCGSNEPKTFSTDCWVSTKREDVISLTNISFPHLGRKKKEGKYIVRPNLWVSEIFFLVTFFCWGKCPSSAWSFVRERLCCCFLLFFYAGERERRRNHISHYPPKMRTNNTDLPFFSSKIFFKKKLYVYIGQLLKF